jgi:hypothetical protein
MSKIKVGAFSVSISTGLATEPPVTIASGQAELNLRKIASGHGEKRDSFV